MGHGIGRSGDVSAVQPKAAGSSLIAKLTKHLSKDAIKLCGYQDVADAIILPLATGMTLTLCLQTIKSTRMQAKYVLWPRIDQKTCLKCIITANLTPIAIENIIEVPLSFSQLGRYDYYKPQPPS
jgi:O-phospho-L-seryl-tRNASec:L-selenocysteinyl-tRNA synthase